MRILGLDPSLTSTGWGVIEVNGNRLQYVADGFIPTDPKTPIEDRLELIFFAKKNDNAFFVFTADDIKTQYGMTVDIPAYGDWVYTNGLPVQNTVYGVGELVHCTDENGEKLTNRGGNYICVNGKWIERFRYYECGEKEDCVPESVRCQASPAIGTACNNEGVPAEFDGCTLICSGGAYLYAPPPVW